MAHCLDRSVEDSLRKIEGNNICCDCNSKNPQWASVPFGIFMCLECSGRHRALGVHISFVRSVSMDSWTPKQIEMMANGGNAACNTFLKKYNVSSGTHSISQKYNSPAASLYRARLLAIVEKRDPPTELPSDHPDMGGSGGDDHGSDPLPGETEEAYVARQRKLQEQARERMRQKFGSSSGLSSSGGGGRMQGIGSDSSYQPGGVGLSSQDLSSQMSGAFSYLTTAIDSGSKSLQDAKITEKVTSSWQSLIQGASRNDQASEPPSGEENVLGVFSQTLGGFWSQASAATSSIVTSLTDDTEEPIFPRGNFGDGKVPDKPQQPTGNVNTEDALKGGMSASPIMPPAGEVRRATSGPSLSSQLSNSVQLERSAIPKAKSNISPAVKHSKSASALSEQKKDDDTDFFSSFGVK